MHLAPRRTGTDTEHGTCSPLPSRNIALPVCHPVEPITVQWTHRWSQVQLSVKPQPPSHINAHLGVGNPGWGVCVCHAQRLRSLHPHAPGTRPLPFHCLARCVLAHFYRNYGDSGWTGLSDAPVTSKGVIFNHLT